MGSAPPLSPLGLTSNVCPSISPVYRPLCDSPSRVATRVPLERTRDFWVLPQRHGSFPPFLDARQSEQCAHIVHIVGVFDAPRGVCIPRIPSQRPLHPFTSVSSPVAPRVEWTVTLCVCVCVTSAALPSPPRALLCSPVAHCSQVERFNGRRRERVLCSAYAHSRAADMSRAKS